MRVAKLVMSGVGVAALVAVSSGTAYAGEITGNGKPTQGPAHSSSICSFSGQNDTPAAGTMSNKKTAMSDPETGQVQNYGQFARLGLKAFVPSPGMACNGHSGFFAGGGGE